MELKRFWVPVGVSLFLTPVFIVAAIIPAGIGRGSYLGAMVLFPYTMLWAVVSGSSITPPLILLALIQFPAYGLILGLAGIQRRLILAAFVLLAIHALAFGGIPAWQWHCTHMPSALLEKAVRNGDAVGVKQLLDGGADPNKSVTPNCSLLGIATQDGRVEIVKLLLDKGVNVNIQDGFDGGTSLFTAVLFRREPVARLLLARGADLGIRNSDGHTILELARLWQADRLERSKPGYLEYTPAEREQDARMISLLEAAEAGAAQTQPNGAAQ